MNMKNYLKRFNGKIIKVNFLIFISFLIIFELLFGNWLNQNNFGIHKRGNINAKYKVETVINGKKKDFIFQTNSMGFRNPEIPGEDIDIIFLGGSTTIQSKIPYEKTIVGILNEKFEKKINIVNAGSEGKSTYGYLCDFKYWFSKIENLNPKYYIFYSGINDARNQKNTKLLDCNDQTSRRNINDKIMDYLINSSFILTKVKILKHEYFQSKLYFENKNEYSKFINFEEAKRKFQDLKHESEALNTYKTNLEKLNKVISEKKISPIFITQVEQKGNGNLSLYLTNQETKKFAKKNNFILIKLDEEIVLDQIDFYDGVHLTEEGSQKVANYLYDKLVNYIN